MSKPLEDILIVDFTQFLSGPYASLRLADLGARVIKIEQPITGDICRDLYVSNLDMNGESSIFRAINRNKESFQADLKDAKQQAQVHDLISRADVVLHNFRPGVAERLGIGFDRLKKINSSLIYGEISGYGPDGPWKHKPGQDLLLQSVTGLTWINGIDDGTPTPVGLAIVDLLSGAHLAQGVLAAIYQRLKSGEGSKVSVSMLESIIDFQFESITTFYHDGGQPTVRPKSSGAHAYLGAPYGIYKTSNGHLALAMGSIPAIGELIGLSALQEYETPDSWFEKRDEIKSLLEDHLLSESSEHWLSILEPADIWCAMVMDWQSLMDEDAFKVLNMIQKVEMTDGYKYETLRCPIRIDGDYFLSPKGSPILGEDTESILNELKTKN